MASSEDPIVLTFPRGIDNRSPETGLPEGSLREAQNVDIYRDGSVKRRPGYTQRYSGTLCHSLWSDPQLTYAIFVDNGTLKRLEKDGTTSTLGTGYHPSAYMSYTMHNNVVYFSNGSDTGKIVNGVVSAWGVPVPGSPVPVATTGYLVAGEYQITWASVLSSGEVSGAPRSSSITLSSPGGISIAVPSLSVSKLRVYMTPVNGDVFYRVGDATPGTTYVIDHHQGGEQLRTLLSRQPYPGTIVRSYRGRIYIVSGTAIWYTEPFNANLITPARGYLQYSEPVTMVAPQTDGLYIGTRSRTYWFAGPDPQMLEDQHVAHPYGAIIGSHIDIPSDWFAVEGVGDRGFAPCWRDSEGVVCIGRPGGGVQRINPDQFKLTNYNYGSQVAVVREGLHQVLGSLWQRDGEIASFGDTVVAEVVQHGLT